MTVLGVRALLLTLLLGLVACSGSDDPAPARDEADPPGATALPSEPDGLVLAETDVCDLVRAGVDAFNLGDVDGTIAAFEKAVGPAEDLARDQPSAATETLLDAVRYYAELPADEYVEANQSSPEFQRYKAFTLTECAYAGPPDGATPSDPGIPA